MDPGRMATEGPRTITPCTTPLVSPIPGVDPAAEEAESQLLLAKAHEFALEWIKDQHGSAADFVQAMGEKFGSKVRMHLLDVVRDLLDRATLTRALKEYLDATLSEMQLKLALGTRPERQEEELSSLDELFARSKIFQSSAKFTEAIDFVSRFRNYSPFNNILVYLQNPTATFWATATHWQRAFHRRVKDDARPMVILAPMTPVILVYDIDDTEGGQLPDWFDDPFATEGAFSEAVLSMTIVNCSRDRVQLAYKRLGMLHAGSATQLDRGTDTKVCVEINQDLDAKGRYSTLCHELSHIHLGHLGSDKDQWWPSRLCLTKSQREIEAEAVSYIVCRRVGLTTKSAEYLAGYIKNLDDLKRISIDLIVKVAGLVERMGEKELPPRKPKQQT